MSAYNGWTNYETWAVALWIDNEQGDQEYWIERATEAWADAEMASQVIEGIWTHPQAARFILADQLKDWHEEHAPDLGASMWADLLNAAMSEVNWPEIARHMIETAKEQAA